MSFEQHLAGLALFLLVAAGPVPLCLASVLTRGNAALQAGPARNLLAVLVGWCVVQALVALALGAVGQFRVSGVAAAEALVLASGTALLARARRTSPGVKPPRPFRLDRPATVSEVLVVGSICALGVALIWRVATQPITEHDSLAYHLPAVATWYQAGSFERLDQWPLFRYYPFTWEAVCALFVIPFGEDFLAALPNLALWAVFGLAIYELGRAAGADRAAGVGTAAIALSLPILVRNVNTMHVDLAVGAFFLAAVAFGARYARQGSPADLGLWFASTGMVAGVKTSGLLYAALALVAIGVLLVLRRGRRQSRPAGRGEVAAGVLGVLAGLAIGGFWYARNWIEAGNPLGAVSVKVWGLTLFPGKYEIEHFRSTSLARVFDIWSPADYHILSDQLREQFGWGLAALAVLGALALPALFVGRKRTGRAPLIGLLALVAATAYLYVLTPYSGDNGLHGGMLHPSIGPSMRYAFPFCGALAAVAAAAATAVRIPGGALAALGIAAIAVRTASLEAALWGLLFLAAWLVVWRIWLKFAARPRGRRVRILTVAAAAGCALGLAAVTFSARAERQRQRLVSYGEIVQFIERETRPDETIGHLLCNQSYLLYGSNLSRRVVFMPVDSHERREWLRCIGALGIDVIAVGPCGRMRRKGWATRDWLEEGGLPVRRVFGRNFSQETFLYRLTPEE